MAFRNVPHQKGQSRRLLYVLGLGIVPVLWHLESMHRKLSAVHVLKLLVAVQERIPSPIGSFSRILAGGAWSIVNSCSARPQCAHLLHQPICNPFIFELLLNQMSADVANSSSKKADDFWAFDFRTPLCHINDSDDSDDPDEPTISNEAKLRKDLDLSTREETVVYKPNPFSIAKANAAYRSNASNKKVPLPPSRAIKPGQKTLFEGSETQKKRITLPAPRTMPISAKVAPTRSKDAEAETRKSAKEHSVGHVVIPKANAAPLSSSSNFSANVSKSLHVTQNEHKVPQNAHIWAKAEQNDNTGPIDTCLDTEFRRLIVYFSPILIFSRHT